MLTNPKNPRVREAAKLALRRQRNLSGLFLLEGPQAVREALDFAPELIVELFVTDAAAQRHPDLLAAAVASGIRAEFVSDQVMLVLSDTVQPQGFVAVAKQNSAALSDAVTAQSRLIVVCEQVRDPGNLGTIIRVADAAGADAVVLTGDCVDQFHPKVVRSTTGSLFHVPVISGVDLLAVAEHLRELGVQLLAADVSGILFDPKDTELLSRPTAWLFGNEARGLTDDQLALAHRPVRLPIYGTAESLNLATAASVLIYTSAFVQHSSR